MKQLVQSVRNGELRLVETPKPYIGPTEVLVRTRRSLVSAGTERAVRQLASSNLLAKAKARPDLVRQVIKKARTEGLRATARTIQSRLDDDMPLGYSAAGTVIEVGAAVDGVRPGDRVATGGAGHAELQAVSGMLAVRIPNGIDDEAASFATVGAIALNGLRLADVGPGASVVVIGLGLVGQLTARLARAAGCGVVGVDVRQWPVDKAEDHTDLALVDNADDTTNAIHDFTRGRGADAVIVSAATKSSDPMRRATDFARDRAILVLVGDVGLDLDRRPLYDKELQLRVARSYGPGRYDPAYEDLGIDYPVGHVRWTEGRNLEAVLDLIATRRLEVADLVTHRFPFDDALDAYALLDGDDPYLAVQLVYPDAPPAPQPKPTPATTASNGIGLIGAGAFARTVLLPGLKEAGFTDFVAVSSASGLSAASLVDKGTFRQAADSPEALIEDPAVGVVVIATPHDTHAALAARALRAGKHVFCEKPLALDDEELSDVADAYRSNPGVLFVGLNRRWSPAIDALKHHLTGDGPLMITYRVNAGPIPSDHWYRDRRQGGRLIGEVCQFIDTCAAITESPITSAFASGSGTNETLIDPDVAVLLRFADGSQAAITYASAGHTKTPKERIEILGRGHTAVLTDFTSLDLDGKTIWSGPQDKGHTQLLAHLYRTVTTNRDGDNGEPALASTAATLAAAASLLTGESLPPLDR